MSNNEVAFLIILSYCETVLKFEFKIFINLFHESYKANSTQCYQSRKTKMCIYISSSEYDSISDSGYSSESVSEKSISESASEESMSESDS